MVLTRSRRFSEVESNFNISATDLEALVAATSKQCAVVRGLRKKLPSISFRPNAPLDVWKEQILSTLPAELRPVSPPQLAEIDVPTDCVDVDVSDASILSQNRVFEEPAGTQCDEQHYCEALEEARLTISTLRTEIFGLKLQLRQREITQQQILQPEQSFEEDFDTPLPSPPISLHDNLSFVITGLPQCSLTRQNVGVAVVQVFRETLHLQSVPSFKVVKVFVHARAPQRETVGALIRVRSDAEVAAVFAAKRQFLTASSPISIDRNRSKQQRRARINTRAGGRGGSSAGSREAPPLEDIGTSNSSLNPNAVIFVPASMSQAPAPCSIPTTVTNVVPVSMSQTHDVCSAPILVTGEEDEH